MANLNRLIAIIWLVFWGYWLIAARGVKKNIRREYDWWRWASVALAVTFFLATWIPHLQRRLIPEGAVTDDIGFAIMAAGIWFAIWARHHLGRNWSATPSVKEGHELVTSGPYRLVRHPIYTGILVAMAGTAMVGARVWLLVFAGFSIIFSCRARAEERLMMQQFPGEYPEYKKRTKALIPFLL